MFRFFKFCLLLFIPLLVAETSAQSWMKVQQIDTTTVYTIISHNGSLYIHTANEIFTSSDGTNWQPITTFPAISGFLSGLYSYGLYIYAGSSGNGVFRSDNGGQSWQPFSNGLGGFSASIVGFAGLGDSLYLGTNGAGVYVINLQNPNSWTAWNTGLYQAGIVALGTSGNNIVASAGLNLFIRARDGNEWTDIYPDTSYSQLMVYETMELDGYLFAGTGKGIYRSTPDGRDWQKTDIDVFQNEDIVALTSFNSKLIAGLLYQGQHWIFTSDDMGENWDIHAHEFAWLLDLFVTGNRLWACRTDGLWYFDNTGWTGLNDPQPVPAGYSLLQNYPNPFNPSTKIAFITAKTGPVDIRIYDINGREVATLFKGIKPAGRHVINFNPRNLSGGVYIYRLKSGAFVQSRKMILVR